MYVYEFWQRPQTSYTIVSAVVSFYLKFKFYAKKYIVNIFHLCQLIESRVTQLRYLSLTDALVYET